MLSRKVDFRLIIVFCLYVRYKHRREPVTLLVAGPDVQVIAEDGSGLRQLILDAHRNYQPGERVADSTMS